MHFAPLTVLGLVSQAAALAAPDYPGFTIAWKDTFDGPAGSPPNPANWALQAPHVNNEQQTYDLQHTGTGQLSGGSTLQIIPTLVGGVWHSSRFEGKYLVKPTPGKVTRGEATIRFGNNAEANKQGMWPAFWMLGDSIRHGTQWPACGEIDILETVNGKLTGYGTMHCDVIPGGVCNEGMGLQSSIPMPNDGWHNWRVEWDLTNGDWRAQTITWFMDGRQFHQVSGAKLGKPEVWTALAHSDLFFILNVAVGGVWVSRSSM